MQHKHMCCIPYEINIKIGGNIMALFNTLDRKNIMNYILSFAEQNEHIISLIAVGSGSFGYVDELSDIDLVVAIDSNENLNIVRDYIASKLSEQVSFIYFKQPQCIPLQVYLCDNFLEIDIGYGVYTTAAATREHWKVLFDKSGTVNEAMHNSWEQIINKPKTNEYTNKLAECSDHVWHNLMHCAVAIKRKQYWRAVAELDIVRNFLVELLGFRYSLDIKRGRDVDKLPEIELITLKKTLVIDFSQEALWFNLISITDAIYTELERCEEQFCIKINRQQINEYIEACRNF